MPALPKALQSHVTRRDLNVLGFKLSGYIGIAQGFYGDSNGLAWRLCRIYDSAKFAGVLAIYFVCALSGVQEGVVGTMKKCVIESCHGAQLLLSILTTGESRVQGLFLATFTLFWVQHVCGEIGIPLGHRQTSLRP